jgi:acetyltransferase-like isoleucine patch superfamily enzyme
MNYYVHPSAEVSRKAIIGRGTKIWHLAQIRERVVIGKNCIIGKNVYIDTGVIIGNNCKIQNNASVYRGTTIEDGVFIGPHVICANDKFPKAINPNGTLKDNDDWHVTPIKIKYGSAIGAGSVLLPGITVGKHALIGAGSVVTKDIPDNAVAYGNPAKIMKKLKSPHSSTLPDKSPK